MKPDAFNASALRQQDHCKLKSSLCDLVGLGQCELQNEICPHENKTQGVAGEMAQWLGALAALMHSSGLSVYQACSWCTDKRASKALICVKRKKSFLKHEWRRENESVN